MVFVQMKCAKVCTSCRTNTHVLDQTKVICPAAMVGSVGVRIRMRVVSCWANI